MRLFQKKKADTNYKDNLCEMQNPLGRFYRKFECDSSNQETPLNSVNDMMGKMNEKSTMIFYQGTLQFSPYFSCNISLK